jgi:ubiquinone/menaquinone biosynthesis C-methylase UbiE
VKTNNGGTKKIIINPDIVADFTNLPFEDETFSLVIFDPPHAKQISENSLLWKEYTDLRGNWQKMLKKGFEECMRVLQTNGVLVLKWSDVHYSTRELINAIGKEPLFGHRSGKKINTHWMCFMKFEDEKN